MLPEILLAIALVSFGLMIIACFCAFSAFRIGRRTLPKIRIKDKEFYLELVGSKGISWIERRADSIKDFSTWWRLYSSLYRGDRVSDIVGIELTRCFLRYFQVMIISFAGSVLLATSVILIGFILTKNNFG